MRGSIVAQVQYLFHASGIDLIGKKRRDVKERARALGARTSAEIGAVTPITGYATADKYRDIWLLLCDHTKVDGKRFDIEELSAQDVKDYLEENVIEAGLSLSTFLTYAAGLGKLETTLNAYARRFGTGRTYEFREEIDDLRPIARKELHYERSTREYRDLLGLIGCIRNKSFMIGAMIQCEGGARIREAALIRASQLLGISYDPTAGANVGTIQLTSTATKGGRERQIHVSVATYERLSRVITECGEYRFDHDAYRRELRRSAEESRQEYHGSHGLRYNFAQRRYKEYLNKGLGETQAKLKVAEEMGHSRPSITEWYLGKTVQAAS